MLEQFEARRVELAQELAEQAGNDSLRDKFVVGYLAAINDIQNVDVEEVTLD